MFSKEFMSFLIKYQAEENELNKVETIKEIEFKSNFNSRLAQVYITVKNR